MDSWGVLEEAGRLPVRGQTSVAYLIQGEEDVAGKEAAMFGNASDVFVLTFRRRRPNALFFPESRLAEGRNALILAAAAQELRRGHRYTYYTLLDADAESTPEWHQAVPAFEAFLQDWAPAVGVPTYGEPFTHVPGGVDTGVEPQSIWHFDHIFIAVHWEAFPALLPYDVAFDDTCAWVSQWSMSLLAGALFREHVLMLPSVRVLNPVHSKYPKVNCMRQFLNASLRLRAAAPARAASCFPDPPPPSVIRMPGQANLPNAAGGLQFGSYLPWGVARRKQESQSRRLVNYSAASLDAITPCDSEATVQALAVPVSAAWSWCRGCTAPEAYWILQVMTAAQPRHASNWNSLGVWMKFIGEDEQYGWEARFAHFRLANACFSIAQRLLQLEGHPPEYTVEENLIMIRKLLTKGGHGPDPDLWRDGGGNLRRVISLVLRPQTEDPSVELFSEASIQGLVAFLLGPGGGPS